MAGNIRKERRASTEGRQSVRLITRKWPPAIGGMETYSAKLAEGLRKLGPVEIIALPGRKSGREPAILSLISFGFVTANKLLFASEAQVVHVTDAASWPLAWIASVRHRRSRIVISAHGSDLSFGERAGFGSKLYRTYLRVGSRLLRRAQIIANSNYIAELARRVGFQDVVVVPLGTDFHMTTHERRQNLLYAGRISRAKGLRFIVEEVLPLLPSDIRLRVAGAVREESERALLSNPRVDYAGTLSPDELADEFSRAVAVLVPTRESEGFGLVAIEAAACGAWVIASDHTGLADVVRPPIGTALDANDAKGWAAAVQSALSRTAGQRNSDILAARSEVDRRYRWPRVIEKAVAIYQGEKRK